MVLPLPWVSSEGDGGSPGYNFAVSMYVKSESSTLKHKEEKRTCSHDVLTNTGGPSSIVMNVGINFSRKYGYCCELQINSIESRSSVATWNLGLTSTEIRSLARCRNQT